MNTTMTMSPKLCNKIIWDSEFDEDNMSIEKVFIENTTEVQSKLLRNKLNILIEFFREKYEYKWSNMNNMSIDEDVNNMSINDDMNKAYYTKKRIEINDNIYEFETFFMYLIRYEDNMFIAENEYFEILGYGNTISEAEKELYENIEDLWTIYAMESDENLDNGAIELKNKLLKSIRKM